jgi:hypothetical protein
VWASATTDPRAVFTGVGNLRTAGTWQGYSFTADINLTDGQQHDIALYAFDWSRSGRSEKIQAIDPATGRVLDTRTLSDFGGGEYLVYKVAGHVQFRVTALSGAAAYLGGIFFDPVAATSPPASPPPVSPPNVPPPPANTAPHISDVTNQTVQAGGTAGPLSFTVSDAETAAGSLTVTASSSNPALVPASGIALGGSGGSRTVSVTPAAGQTGTATLTLTVTDAGGLTATDTFTLTVTSPPPPPASPPPVSPPPAIPPVIISPPSGTFGNSGSVGEGGSATAQILGVSDPLGQVLTYSFDFGNDGTFDVTGSASASASVPANLLADGPKSVVVRGRITALDGRFSDYTTTIQVNNVAPTPAISGPAGATPGTSVTFTTSATDPSPADAAAGFTYAWNFGDGSTGSGSSVTHTYSAAGTYAITVTATDKDGGVSTTSRTFTVATPSASGITVTPDWIITPYDKIPNFGGHPTRTAVQSGPWSDPATWGGQLPVAGDVVSVPNGVTITYDQVSDVEYDTVALQAGGTLQFRTDVTTRLRVTNLLVMEGGTLTVGTTANPVAMGVKAEIVINDGLIDTTKDPDQYGHGLIAMGTVTMHGAPLSATFVNLAVEPKAGDTTLTLSTPVTGWTVGNRLVLPDTRQLVQERWSYYTPQWELANIASISADGRVITLASPLQFDHLGARNPDGVLKFLPDVGNLSRNVVVHSENIRGTRGYAMFTMRADVDIEYAQFGGLGRTADTADDNTIYDADGNVAHVGTNQSGRYPVYFSHLMGPAVTPADGYQFTFSGDSVFCPLDPMPFRWGVVLNHTDYGLVKDNVLYNWAGAGLVGESGAESYNLIQHNFVVGIRGDTNPQLNTGRDGSAYWFRGWNNYFRDNVATDAVNTFQSIVAGSGFNLFSPVVSAADTPVPLFPGANMMDPSQYKLIDLQATPVLEFTGNVAYGAMATGLTLWALGTTGYTDSVIGQSVFKNFTAWHVWEDGVFAYPINNVLFDGLTVLGDSRAFSYGPDTGRGFASSDYRVNNVTIRNADIEGMYKGITYATDIQGTFTIEDSYFRNYSDNIEVQTLAVGGSGAPTNAKKTVISNVRFDPYPGAPSFTTIDMDYSAYANNYVQKDEVYVYNYNGIPGDNFQLFYLEQAPDFVVPQTAYYGPDYNGDGVGDFVAVHGSTETGLTNAQNWAKYGIAIGGAVSPTSNTRANIHGFVLPLQ